MYIIATWVIVQVASLVFPAIDIADAAIRYVWLGAILAFPLLIVFAWRYDLTPDGLVRTPPVGDQIDLDFQLRRVDYLILLTLVAVGVAMSYQLGSEIREMGTSSLSSIPVVEPDSASIAVLPFENISQDSEQQYFVDGMHETLIADLSRVSALRVISRTSSRLYRDSQKPLKQIGIELGVANIIEGSVYRVGNDVRISIQLINALTDQLRWASSYERKLENILSLQSEVARSIASEVRVLLTPEEEAFFSESKIVDPEAYEDYLKGRFHWYRFGPQDLELSLEYFQAALDKDSDYALAYVGYADALATTAHLGLKPATEVFPRAVELVNKALKLDPQLAEAHDLAARIKFVWDHDWAGAETGFQESIRLKPSFPDAHIVYSQFLGINERWEESLLEARKGLRLDPYKNWFRMALGTRLAWAGRYDEALLEYRILEEAQPTWPPVYRNLSELHFYRGELLDSLAAMKKYFELSGRQNLAELVSRFDGNSEFAAAMKALADELLDAASETYISEFEMARVYAFAGEVEQTLDWLEMAYENRDTQLVYSVAEPLFSLVWDHPRYADLRQKLNLPPRE
jgi:TolB-like protein